LHAPQFVALVRMSPHADDEPSPGPPESPLDDDDEDDDDDDDDDDEDAPASGVVGLLLSVDPVTENPHAAPVRMMATITIVVCPRRAISRAGL
jgi:hypothetical protein